MSKREYDTDSSKAKVRTDHGKGEMRKVSSHRTCASPSVKRGGPLTAADVVLDLLLLLLLCHRPTSMIDVLLSLAAHNKAATTVLWLAGWLAAPDHSDLSSRPPIADGVSGEGL